MDTLQFYEVTFKHPCTYNDCILAGISINGKPLDEIVEHYEKIGADKGGLKIDIGRYAFSHIDYLYYELIDNSQSYKKPGIATLLICPACLELGCAPFNVEIKETDTEVIWHGFQNHNGARVREDGTFIDYSVFPTYRFDKEEYKKALQNLEEMYQKGVWISKRPSITGAITGDIIGSCYEFNNIKTKLFKLFTDECKFTDDTVMTIAVAKAVMETAKEIPLSDCLYDKSACELLAGNTIKYMQEIGRKYPYCGYGGMFHRWMFSDAPEPYNSFGNGAAMRVSSVGIIASGVEEAECLAEIVTAVTHNHEEGIKGAKATAAAIAMANQKRPKNEIEKYIKEKYYPQHIFIDDLRRSYVHNETCQETVPQAIECFLASNSYEDAIRIAISIGGDSDTIAAITGAIAEAYYGMPGEIEWKARSYLDAELSAILDEWERFTGEHTDKKYEELKKTLAGIICEAKLAKTKRELEDIRARADMLNAENNVPNVLKRLYCESFWDILLQHYE